MSNMRSVRVGLVGCGIIAQWQHIPGLLQAGGAEIAAICDRDAALLEQVGRRLRSAGRYEDFGRMLAQEKLDMVDICTPPQTHAALAIQAADCGCHVLVEKPAALTVEEFDRAAEACSRSGVKLCQIQNKMFEPVFRQTMSRVRQGEIGEVTGVEVRMLSERTAALASNPQHWTHDLPAGIFTEMLPHPIYVIQSFLGAVDVADVHVGGLQRRGDAASFHITAVLEGQSGVGVITCSGPAPKDKTIIDVHGTRKNLRVDLWNSARTFYGIGGTSRASRAAENLGQTLSLLGCTAGTTLSVISGRFLRGHAAEIREFIRSIQDGTEPPVTVAQAREVIRVLDGIAVLVGSSRPS